MSLGESVARSEESAPVRGLEAFLVELAHAGVELNVSERVAIRALATELIGLGAVETLDDFKPYLKAVLARTPEQTRLFATTPTAEPDAPDADALLRRIDQGAASARRSILAAWRGLAALAAVLAIAALGWTFRAEIIATFQTSEAPEGPTATAAPSSEARAPTGTGEDRPPQTEAELEGPAATIARILDAALAQDGAPTLLELSRNLEVSPALRATPENLARALHELTGAPLHLPLDLVGKSPLEAVSLEGTRRAVGSEEGVTVFDARSGREIARLRGFVGVTSIAFSPDGSRLATGLEDGETRLWDAATGAELLVLPGTDAVVDVGFSSDGAQITTALRDGGEQSWDAGTGELLERRVAASPLPVAWAPILARALDRLEKPGPVAPPSAYDLSIDALKDQVDRISALRAASDRRAETATSATTTPAWVALLSATVPLALGALWLLARFLSERPYLRRRRPRRPPNRTEFVAEALANAFVWTPTDQRLAQTLMARDDRETDRLDVRRTIDASLALGGHVIALQTERLRPVPEYLVLIEEDQAGDHIAQRLRDLLIPFRKNAHLHFDVYTYQDAPILLRTEDGAAALTLEAVRAKHPDHRLIILGTGHAFVASRDSAPHPFVDILRQWERRVLLTPQPLSEWGRREFMVAEALDAPVGRATRNGFRIVGDLLGLEGPPPDPAPDPTGDGRLGELPESIRLDPHRLLYEDPPADIEIDDLLRDLIFFLDRDGFRWLSALAVFPVIQWDLTLYLGLRLPTERDLLFRRVDPIEAKNNGVLVREEDLRAHCFRDDALGDRRLSALSRLPWLRRGSMPDWLREALIERLSEVDRGEIYRAIDQALESAEIAAEVSGEIDRRIRLRIGRDASRGRPEDFTPREDELLLDFLKRGDRGDYPLPVGFQDRFRRQSDSFLSAGRNHRLAAIAILTAIAAWVVAPSPGMAPPTGAWWPLVLVGLGAGLALLAERIFDRDPSSPLRLPRLQFSSAPKIDDAPRHRPAQPRFAPLSIFQDGLSDGSKGPEMVIIPPGTFLMGSPPDERERYENEGPQHSVTFSQPFALGRYAVTFSEYDIFCEATGRKKPADKGWGRGRRPAINVSHKDAEAYCAWLSEQTRQPYRLPSEAEWEYACRSGTTTAYSFGDDARALSEHAWHYQNSDSQTHPVGGKRANAFGLYDMHGNVLEWCADAWSDSYKGAPKDGSARISGDKSRAVLRGGSWDNEALSLRSASRVRGRRDIRNDGIGFRLARTLPDD